MTNGAWNYDISILKVIVPNPFRYVLNELLNCFPTGIIPTLHGLVELHTDSARFPADYMRSIASHEGGSSVRKLLFGLKGRSNKTIGAN